MKINHMVSTVKHVLSLMQSGARAVSNEENIPDVGGSYFASPVHLRRISSNFQQPSGQR